MPSHILEKIKMKRKVLFPLGHVSDCALSGEVFLSLLSPGEAALLNSSQLTADLVRICWLTPEQLKY